MNVTVIGLGSVALADALALARRHRVTVTGPDPDRLAAVAAGRYPLDDPDLAGYLARHAPRLAVAADLGQALAGAGAVLIATPLPLGPDGAGPDTAELDAAVAAAVAGAPGALVVIRSAVPVGHTDRLRARHPGARIVVAPECADPAAPLGGVLHPDLILIGDRGADGAQAAALLADAALRPGPTIRYLEPAEAEAARHLSLLMQAARLAFFGELDSYALAEGLDAAAIIEGVCLDPRVGRHQANPCFGPGGPLLALAEAALADLAGDLALHVLPAIAPARERRLDFLADRIRAAEPARVLMVHDHRPGAARRPITLLADRLRRAGLVVCDLAAAAAGGAGAGDLVLARARADAATAAGWPVFSRDLAAGGACGLL